MAPENTTTDATLTTNETTTQPVDGSDKGTSQSTTSSIADALGDGTGGGDRTPPSKPEDKPAGAPEAYTAWTTPEGYELDTGLVEQASPLFKELNLTQAQAQKLVDFYSDHAIKTAKAAQDGVDAMQTQWRTEMKNDATLKPLAGQDGNFGKDSPLMQTLSAAMDGLQNPKLVADFKAAMDLTGAGNNPAFVKVFYALARQVTEGSDYVQGQPTARTNARPTAAAAMYPNLKPAG